MTRLASLALGLALLAPLLTASTVRAQPRPLGDGLYRIEGTVISINRETSTIALRQRGRTSMLWTVRFTDSTSISYRNTITSVDDVKVGRRIVCLGRYGQKGAKNEMTAVVVDVRSGE
jgi:hypothetical protein